MTNTDDIVRDFDRVINRKIKAATGRELEFFLHAKLTVKRRLSLCPPDNRSELVTAALDQLDRSAV